MALPGEQLVYVYDDPAVDWSNLVECYVDKHGVAPWRHEAGEHAQNMGEVWIHQALLRHPLRTTDPEQASLFYVPLYATVSSDSEPLLGSLECNGTTHMERVDGALDFLEKESKYFMRFGGADHFIACGWWRCGVALGNRARVVLSRTVLGINESPPENTYWARWECVNRVLTIPYVSSTRIPIALFASDEEYTTRPRSIPFFFAGRTRGRVERENLAVISEMVPGSLIGVTAWDWTEDPGAYGDHISRSVFCLCPRGDTRSSRRLFDAVAAGCIPVMTRSQARPGNAPFADSLDYSGFAVLLEEDAFSTREKVATFTDALQGYDQGTILEKRHALLRAREVLVYGYSTGESFEDMLFSEGTLRALLLDVGRLATSSTLWGCEPTPWWKFPADRVAVSLPPTADDERNWAVGVSTILLREEKILVCVPPFTGSRPVRDFVKTVQKASTWEVKNFQSGHDVLRIESGDMFEVYASVGWKKTSMLRDPVTRLLSSFLLRNTSVTAADFKRFVRGLYETNVEEIPMVYRPQSSFCGMKYVHFDSLLLYEDRARSKQILESLPNDIWTKHGRNWKGTGRDVFDVESRDQYFMGLSGVTTDKCGRWTRYFDAQTLDMVASIYSEDYQAYRWYSVDLWKSRRDACVN